MSNMPNRPKKATELIKESITLAFATVAYFVCALISQGWHSEKIDGYAKLDVIFYTEGKSLETKLSESMLVFFENSIAGKLEEIDQLAVDQMMSSLGEVTGNQARNQSEDYNKSRKSYVADAIVYEIYGCVAKLDTHSQRTCLMEKFHSDGKSLERLGKKIDSFMNLSIAEKEKIKNDIYEFYKNLVYDAAQLETQKTLARSIEHIEKTNNLIQSIGKGCPTNGNCDFLNSETKRSDFATGIAWGKIVERGEDIKRELEQQYRSQKILAEKGTTNPEQFFALVRGAAWPTIVFFLVSLCFLVHRLRDQFAGLVASWISSAPTS